MNMSEERLKKRLKRCRDFIEKLEKKHSGNEHKYTYHGGFNLGYAKGRLAILEEILDEVQECQ